jgi:hypothetical protein
MDIELYAAAAINAARLRAELDPDLTDVYELGRSLLADAAPRKAKPRCYPGPNVEAERGLTIRRRFGAAP